MCYNGNRTVSELSLLNRLHLIRTSVISPIHSLNVKLPFEIRMKPMYNIEQTVFVWNDVVKDLSHESDGLIFTPIEDPYQSGSCFRLLKWKPISMNSVDFKVYAEYIRLFCLWTQAEDSVCYRLQALRDGIDVNFDWISFEGKEEEALWQDAAGISFEIRTEQTRETLSNPSLVWVTVAGGRKYRFSCKPSTGDWVENKVLFPKEKILSFEIGMNPKKEKITYWIRNISLLYRP